MSYRDLSYSMSSVDDELTPLPSLDGDLDVDVAIVGTTDGTGEPESLRWLGINAAAQAMAAADRAETHTGTTARRAPTINRRLGR